MQAPILLILIWLRGRTAPPTNNNGTQRYNISLNYTANAETFKTEMRGRNPMRARPTFRQPRSPPPAAPSAPPIPSSPALTERPHLLPMSRHWKTRSTPSNMTSPSKHASPSAVTCAPSKKYNPQQKSSRSWAPRMRPQPSFPNSAVTMTPKHYPWQTSRPSSLR